MTNPRVAVLDDYEGVLAGSPHVRRLRERVDVDVFREPLSAEQAVEELQPYEILIALRERTPFPATFFESLPRLELVSQSGSHAYHADLDAATRSGVLVASGRSGAGGKRPSLMPELVFGLLVGLLRDIPALHGEMREGGWPSSLGRTLHGQTMGILGLGRHGSAVATVASAFGMSVAAWGPTLTPERADAAGVELLDLDDLLARVDVLSIHLKLSDQSRGLIDRERLGRMQAHAVLVNTARGAIVDEAALAEALASGRLGGAGLDVFTTEPLPEDSPLRRLDNVVLTPHVGWTTDRNLAEFAEDTTGHVHAYLDGKLPRSSLLNEGATEVTRDRSGAVTDS